MQRVTGLDEMYLSLDTGRTVGHIAGITFFDPDPTDPRRGGLDFVRQRVGARLPALPLLRWRLRMVPGWIDQRRWTEVESVDLDYHVTGVTLPAPGTEAQLHAFFDGVMGEALPRDRPLWRIYVVDGLADGRTAYVIKLSHGLADGSALWALVDLLSDSPSEQIVASPHDPEPAFGRLELLVRGMVGLATTPLRATALQAETAWWTAKFLAREKGYGIPSTIARILPGEPGRPFARWANHIQPDHKEHPVASMVPTLRPPHTPIGGDVTNELGAAWVDLSLADLRRAGKLAGGTVNDAILAITAGALRDYLAEHGGVPDRPLIASAPISWRTGHERHRWANHVWMLLLELPTDEPTPLGRLRAARDAANVAKSTWEHLPMHLMRKASALMPTWQIGPGAWLMSRMPARTIPALYNVAVSNVKGPKEIPVFDGRPIARYCVYGFVPPAIGLLLGGQSLGDRFCFSITAARSVVPDFEVLADYVQRELDLLLEEADRADTAGQGSGEPVRALSSARARRARA